MNKSIYIPISYIDLYRTNSSVLDKALPLASLQIQEVKQLPVSWIQTPFLEFNSLCEKVITIMKT